MKNIFFKKFLAAFSLAEVLVTLTIIGTIATLTIPNLYTNYEKQVTATKLEKIYTDLLHASTLAELKYGKISKWKIEHFSGNEQASIDAMEKYILPFVQVLKNCKNETTGDCEYMYTYMDKSRVNAVYDKNYARFFMAGDVLIDVAAYNSENVFTKIVIDVDINGHKKPNRWGRDIFQFVYFIKNYDNPDMTGTFLPSYYEFSREKLLTHKYGCNSNSAGAGCAALIMKDGWKISDDYPW